LALIIKYKLPSNLQLKAIALNVAAFDRLLTLAFSVAL